MPVPPVPLPVLTTRRLRLRPPVQGDVPTLFEIFSHPEVMRYWSFPPIADQSEAEALLRRITQGAADGTYFQWGIALPEGDRLIGTCTLVRLDATHRRSEIGYALGRAWWGSGYAKEALTRLIDYAFADLGLHRLEADTDPRNTGSIRLLERLGFRVEGHLRERWQVGGEIQDSLMFGLLDREWRG